MEPGAGLPVSSLNEGISMRNRYCMLVDLKQLYLA